MSLVWVLYGCYRSVDSRGGGGVHMIDKHCHLSLWMRNRKIEGKWKSQRKVEIEGNRRTP